MEKKHKASAPIITDLSKETFIDASSWKKESDKLNTELNKLNNRINRNSYFDFFEINNNTAPKIQKAQDNLVSDLKQKIISTVDKCKHGIKSAESEHKNKIQEYLGNTGVAILIGSFAVPAIMSLFAMEGWSKLWAIAFCIPYLSQFLSGVCLYEMITGNPVQPKGEFIIAWSLVIYLLASICFFFIVKVTSKGKMGSEIEKNKVILATVSPYAERIKNI